MQNSWAHVCCAKEIYRKIKNQKANEKPKKETENEVKEQPCVLHGSDREREHRNRWKEKFNFEKTSCTTATEKLVKKKENTTTKQRKNWFFLLISSVRVRVRSFKWNNGESGTRAESINLEKVVCVYNFFSLLLLICDVCTSALNILYTSCFFFTRSASSFSLLYFLFRCVYSFNVNT